MSWLTKIFTNRPEVADEELSVEETPSRNRRFGSSASSNAEDVSSEPEGEDSQQPLSPADFSEYAAQPTFDHGDEDLEPASSDTALAQEVAEQESEDYGYAAVSPAAMLTPSYGKSKEASLPRFNTPGHARSVPQASVDRIRPLRRAFTPSHPISDTALFAGRRDLLMRLIHLIEDQGLHVVLYGDRGIGKTSLLRVLAELAEQGNYKVTYASCGSDTDFDSLFRSLAREIPLLYHSDYEPISPEVEAGGTFADLMPARQATVVDVTELFEAVRGTQLLIFIDEFDRCESDRMREQVAELIKNLSDRGVAVQCVIAGVASNLTALVSHIPSIRRNLIGLPLGPLSDTETREMLQAASARSGISFSKAAVDRLIHFSNGLPYLNQLLGLHATIVAVRKEHEAVTEQDVAAALSQATEEIRLRLSSRGLRSADKVGAQIGWDRLGELSRKALLQVGILYDSDIQGLPANELNEILVFSSDDEGERWTFKEEAVVPYVWMKSQVGSV